MAVVVCSKLLFFLLLSSIKQQLKALQFLVFWHTSTAVYRITPYIIN